MKERPILFSGPMVRAILEGRKTQTRRIVKPQPDMEALASMSARWRVGTPNEHATPVQLMNGAIATGNIVSPYGQPGDRLIVKEHVWMWCEKRPNGVTKKGRPKFHYVPMRGALVFYCADYAEKPNGTIVSPRTGNEWGWRKKLGRFMPRWASRITLEVTAVRVERLQDISEEDAKAEGVQPSYSPNFSQSATGAYSVLWESINGAGSWAENPWVWVIEFRRIAP